MSGDDGFIPFLFGTLTGVFVGVLGVAFTDNDYDSGVQATRQQAIDAGAGEWRIDAKTGEKSFHWLTVDEVIEEEAPAAPPENMYERVPKTFKIPKSQRYWDKYPEPAGPPPEV